MRKLLYRLIDNAIFDEVTTWHEPPNYCIIKFKPIPQSCYFSNNDWGNICQEEKVLKESMTLEEAWSEFKDALKSEKPFCWIYRFAIFILDWLESVLKKK